MKIRSSLLVATCLLAATGVASATVLTFDFTGATLNGVIPQNYGDNVTAATMGSFQYGTQYGFTPNITAAYVSSADPAGLRFWTTGYSDLTNVAYNDPDFDAGYSIILTGNSVNVTLYSFDLGNFSVAVVLPGVQILGANNSVLASFTNVNLPSFSNPRVTFSNAAGWSSSEISNRSEHGQAWALTPTTSASTTSLLVKLR